MRVCITLDIQRILLNDSVYNLLEDIWLGLWVTGQSPVSLWYPSRSLVGDGALDVWMALNEAR